MLTAMRQVQLVRNRSPIVVQKGETFDFTDAEAESIRRADPRALRETIVPAPLPLWGDNPGYQADQ